MTRPVPTMPIAAPLRAIIDVEIVQETDERTVRLVILDDAITNPRTIAETVLLTQSEPGKGVALLDFLLLAQDALREHGYQRTGQWLTGVDYYGIWMQTALVAL